MSHYMCGIYNVGTKIKDTIRKHGTPARVLEPSNHATTMLRRFDSEN